MEKVSSSNRLNNHPVLRFPMFLSPWKKETLGKIVAINPSSGKLPNKFYYIDLDSVNKGILVKKKLLTKKEAPYRAKRIISVGDILFQTVRPYQMNNYLVKDDYAYKIVASTGYAQLRTNISIKNAKFLYYLLHSPHFINSVLLKCTGSNYPIVSSADLKNITISYPSIDEQNKIAEFFTLINKKIEKQQELINNFKLYT